MRRRRSRQLGADGTVLTIPQQTKHCVSTPAAAGAVSCTCSIHSDAVAVIYANLCILSYAMGFFLLWNSSSSSCYSFRCQILVLVFVPNKIDSAQFKKYITNDKVYSFLIRLGMIVIELQETRLHIIWMSIDPLMY